jgi:nicotinamide-nucleotide amidase
MVTVSSLCVGKELLIGKTVNTNAHWIGARLLADGIMFDRILTVTDSLEDISSGLHELLQRKPDFVIVIGGLGPTPDDMTLQGVAIALGKRMRPSAKALRMIKDHYIKTGRGEIEMTPPRRKMTILPMGSEPVVNELGTAPAVRMEHSGATIFCLPGVPKEMKSIFRNSVDPEIRRKVGPVRPTRAVMHLEGVFETVLTPSIAEAMRNHPSAYIKSHPRGLRKGKSHVELDVVVTSIRKEDSKAECEDIMAFFTRKIAETGGIITKHTLT